MSRPAARSRGSAGTLEEATRRSLQQTVASAKVQSASNAKAIEARTSVLSVRIGNVEDTLANQP